MPIAPSARIHPTAIISAEADIGPNVEIGAHVVIDGAVQIGADCIIRPFAQLCGPLRMGVGNKVFGGAILGDEPQHLKYAGEPTGVDIGDYNTFREHVTVHRGTTQAWTTRIGSHNYLMVNSHIAHDCHVGNHCILANGALVGGHCTVGDNACLSGNSAVHQFCRIGRLALLSGCSATTKDMPPFAIQQEINNICGVNVVGMRRAGMTPAEIDGVRLAYRYLFRDGMVIPAAIERMEKDLGHLAPIHELITFIRQSKRGINTMRDRHHVVAA